MLNEQNPDNIFEDYRPLLFSIAYRMLGSAMEAEDVVQDAYLRWREAASTTIESPKAYLSTVVTRLCLDYLKSARAQREFYTGPWLPEPILTTAPDQALMPETDQYESLSMAVMVLLESLSSLERAVFILRAVFEYDYAEIAQIVDREEAACRQLFSRARKHIDANRPRFRASREKHAEILRQFLHALDKGDLDGLTSLLAEDVVWTADGGGKTTAARQPVIGRDRVLQFVLGLYKRAPEGIQFDITQINGESGMIMRQAGGPPMYAITFEVSGGQVVAVRAVGNPDKLKAIQSQLP